MTINKQQTKSLTPPASALLLAFLGQPKCEALKITQQRRFAQRNLSPASREQKNRMVVIIYQLDPNAYRFIISTFN